MDVNAIGWVVFIVGQSGAGKGVVAEEVAKQLGWKFINAWVDAANLRPLSCCKACLSC